MSDDPNRGIRTASTVGIYVLIALALIPILGILFCCFGAPLLGAFLPDPSPSP